jgi:SAM-dependent methyltransferase
MRSQTSGRVKTEQAQWYDRVADPYHRSHGGYPDALVDDVVAFAGLKTGGRVLEIGCGTGQATTSFATRGLDILALEPGANLAALARQNLAAFPNVEISTVSFETWKLEPEAFDLIIAARAFHWLDRKIRFVKAAHALKPGGVLASLRSVALPGNAPVNIALQRATAEPTKPRGSARRWPSERQFFTSRYFAVPEKRRYFSADIYDTEHFADRLRSTFAFQRLTAAEREKALDAARRILAENGGTISIPFESQLIMARREANISWLSRLLRRKK